VHHRHEVISAAVVLSQTAESQLGQHPDKQCASLGGMPQPDHVQSLTYDPAHKQLTATAPNAVAVGYVLTSASTTNRAHDKALGTGTQDKQPGFPITLDPATLPTDLQQPNGQAWIGAAVCLADNVPILTSLKINKITYQGTRITADEPACV
jgi:hypothetical protein